MYLDIKNLGRLPKELKKKSIEARKIVLKKKKILII